MVVEGGAFSLDSAVAAKAALAKSAHHGWKAVPTELKKDSSSREETVAS
jgi:hypothetical protein